MDSLCTLYKCFNGAEGKGAFGVLMLRSCVPLFDHFGMSEAMRNNGQSQLLPCLLKEVMRTALSPTPISVFAL